MEKYAFEKKLGEGTYAVVYKGVEKRTGAPVAIKVFKDPFPSWEACLGVPEVKFQARLRHPNVLRVLEVTRVQGVLYLVSEFCDWDLFQVMSARAGSARGLREGEIRSVMKGVLEGLLATHRAGFLHRDVKPENVLLHKSHKGHLQPVLCDFGQAALASRTGSLSPYVATRWYRAPEELFGLRQYGAGVDVWACGCMMGELAIGRPLFPGTSEVDQVRRLEVGIGACDGGWLEGVEGQRKKFGRGGGVGSGGSGVGTLKGVLEGSGLSHSGVDAVLKMLTWNPSHRPSIQDCLRHPFFSSSTSSFTPLLPPPTPPSHTRITGDDAAARAAAARAQEVLELAMKTREASEGGGDIGGGAGGGGGAEGKEEEVDGEDEEDSDWSDDVDGDKKSVGERAAKCGGEAKGAAPRVTKEEVGREESGREEVGREEVGREEEERVERDLSDSRDSFSSEDEGHGVAPPPPSWLAKPG